MGFCFFVLCVSVGKCTLQCRPAKARALLSIVMFPREELPPTALALCDTAASRRRTGVRLIVWPKKKNAFDGFQFSSRLDSGRERGAGPFLSVAIILVGLYWFYYCVTLLFTTYHESLRTTVP